MSIRRKEPIILLLGDLVFLLASLWLALFLRHLEVPSRGLFLEHLAPFSILFAVWIIVFYIAGLYEKHTLILKSRLPAILGSAQIANSLLAVVFFYFIPYFGITPKTILFIYLAVSLAAMVLWRMHGFFYLVRSKPANAILIGSGEEVKELYEEVNGNPIYSFRFVTSVNLDRADDKGFWDEIINKVYAEDVSIIAIDLSSDKVAPVLPHLYNLIFSKVSFVDMNKVYEDIFDRVPLSLLKYNWFIENISSQPRGTYDTLKRIMDIIIGGIAFLVSLPFISLASIGIKLEDNGPIFIYQERIGKNNKQINIVKLRTMSGSDAGEAVLKSSLVETKIGNFLRRTRIDELPQLWNVLKGDLSLIGPRPELPALVKHYEEEVPFYNVRHLIKPGLSGWGQINDYDVPRKGIDVVKTKRKLSYDLYYIKNRSFLLDLKIALKTMRTLVSIAGR